MTTCKMNSEERNSSQSIAIWFTGLPCSGKTTIGQNLLNRLDNIGIKNIILDGDQLRKGLCSDLGFSAKDRAENVRRIAEISVMCASNNITSIVTLISPFEKDRVMAIDVHKKHNIRIVVVYLKTSLEICEKRDVKGLYKLSREHKIQNMTGIDSPYEVPLNPDIIIDTENETIDGCVDMILEYLRNNNLIQSDKLTSTRILELFEPKKTNTGELVPINLTTIDLQWLQVISEGWASPLTGFMNKSQYLQCLHFSSIKDSHSNWKPMSIPIVLPISEETKTKINEAGKTEVSLIYEGREVGIMCDIEIHPHRKKERVHRKFTTASVKHPVVKMIMDSGDWLIGGTVKVFEKIKWNDGLDEFRLTPNQIIALIQANKHDAVVAFQLRNPIHNGHALLINSTLEKIKQRGYRSPVLLLHPLGGYTKDDDVPLLHRIKQHKALMDDGTLDAEKIILAIFPSPMNYAGPTEVLWHRQARRICGADFYIVGRDPAGIADPENPDKDLFDPTHGAEILVAADQDPDSILSYQVVAYNKVNKKMEIYKEDKKHEFEFISGTKMRKFARSGENPPDGFMSPAGWKIISEYYKNLNNA